MRIMKITEQDIVNLNKSSSMAEALFKSFQLQFEKSIDELRFFERSAVDNFGRPSRPLEIHTVSKEEKEATKSIYVPDAEIEPALEYKTDFTRLKLFVNQPAGHIIGLIQHSLPISVTDIQFVLKPDIKSSAGLIFDVSGRYDEIHQIGPLVSAILADLFFIEIDLTPASTA
jgi:hypothetical protein